MHGKYSRIGTSTFSATVRVENSAPFWNSTPQRRRMFLASSSSRPTIDLAEHVDLALVRRLQADDRAQQHRLAGARAADHAENLAAADVEVEVVVDDLLAEAVAQAAHRDDRLAALAERRIGFSGIIPSRSR